MKVLSTVYSGVGRIHTAACAAANRRCQATHRSLHRQDNPGTVELLNASRRIPQHAREGPLPAQKHMC